MENYTINREKKTFVFDDGEELPIPKDKVRQVLRSPTAKKSKQEAVEKWEQFNQSIPAGESGHSFINNLSESILGNPGDTLANYAVSGYKALSPGEGQGEMGYVDRLLDHFYAMQEGRKEHLSQQSEKSPKAALAGQAVGMGAELGLLHGVPGIAALPAMEAAHSDTSFLEPGEKIPEIAQEAVVGGLLDRFFGGASRISGHRATRRGIQDAIRTTEEANAQAIQNAGRATQADAARFAQESAARDAEVARLPELQQAENQAFIDSSAQGVERVSRALGRNPISAEAMGVESFIDSVLDTSIHSGSKEATRASKFLRNVFKGTDGRLSGEAIQRGMRSVDTVMSREGGAMGEILSDFRNFVSENLPSQVGNHFAFEKWIPRIENRLGIENTLVNTFRNSNEVYRDMQNQLGRGFLEDLNHSLTADINTALRKHAGTFESALADGTLSNEVRNVIESNPLYQEMVNNLLEFETFISPKNSKFGAFTTPVPVKPGFQEIKTGVMDLPNTISDAFTNASEKYLTDIALDVTTKSGIADRSFSQMPARPNVVPTPPQVNPAQQFQPQLTNVPTIPEPQGLMQRLAYGLEGISEQGAGGVAQGVRDNATTGLLAKMAGVPVGKIAAGAAAAVTGLSALTSPSAIGRNFRNALEQTTRMIDAVKQRAEAYPSHVGNGVLNDPMERRSLVREIEDDLNMRLEDKAIIQSKVNRGKALIPDI